MRVLDHKMTLPAFNLTGRLPIKQLKAHGSRDNLCRARVATRANRSIPLMVGAAPAAPVKEKVLEKKVDVEKQRKTKKPDMYRLYIYNDPVNTRERVVDVLLKTCQGLSFSRAYSAMQEAHENGRGLVLVIAQEIAEHYCAIINSEGILSSIEPDN